MLIGPQHDPVALARNAETLQAITGGRLELGLGLGHRDAEFDALGLRRDRRGRMLEPVLDAVEGVGARLWLGGMASTTLARAARRGAGLLLPQTMLVDELGPLLQEYRDVGGAGPSASSATSGSSPTPSAPHSCASASSPTTSRRPERGGCSRERSASGTPSSSHASGRASSAR